MKSTLILFIFFIHNAFQLCIAQSRVINVKGDYTHKETSAKFPIKIQDFTRTAVISYNKSKENIGVIYSNENSPGKTTFSIFIYPAGRVEGLLRSEFLYSLKNITFINKPGNIIRKCPIEFKKDGYIINGFKARINDNNKKTDLLLYQCGLWILKIKVSSQILDSLQMAILEREIINIYNPSEFVLHDHLDVKADIHFGKAAFADSLMLGCVMGSALRKIEWAIENVDSLERISGFPDIYLDLQRAALLEFVKFEKDHPAMSRSQSTTKYLAQLNSIIDGGFLNEFIMQQFDMLLKVSPGIILDFNKFEEWKKTKSISINLNSYFALVSYNNSIRKD
jgi:hypothetical protein